MCFIDQSGRDHPFRLDETHVRVKKYCVLSIRMDGAPASYLYGVVTKPVRTPTARAVWGKRKLMKINEHKQEATETQGKNENLAAPNRINPIVKDRLIQ